MIRYGHLFAAVRCIAMRDLILLFHACVLAVGVFVGAVRAEAQASSPAAVVKVAAGGAHSLLLRSDGTLWSVGHNGDGQLGDGTTVHRAVPTQIATDVVDVAAGWSHSLFLKTDRTLWVMGSNSSGQLGLGDWVTRASPVQVASGVVFIAARYHVSCFITEDGRLWAMGWSWSGLFGLGPESNAQSYNSPMELAADVARVAIGNGHMLIVQHDGTVQATGLNERGQLGDGSVVNRAAFAPVLKGAIDVAAGAAHSLVLLRDGSVWGFGMGDFGQLGESVRGERTLPVQVARGITQIWAVEYTSYFRDASGALWQSGVRREGTSDKDLALVLRQNGVLTMAASPWHDLFVCADGTLKVRGRNFYGQLGLGSTSGTETQWLPLQTAFTGNFVSPDAPRSLNAVSSVGRVSLDWGGAPGAAEYEIWRSITADPATAVRVTAQSNTLAWEDTTATWETDYYYWVRATNAAGASALTGGVVGRAMAGEAPQIVRQPQGATASLEGVLKLEVAADGTQPMAYRWKKNGVFLSNETGPVLLISAVQVSDGGTYSVEVTNGGGCVVSDGAVVEVVPRAGVLHVWIGGIHSLFLRTDGTLWGMGAGFSNVLGNGDQPTLSPVLIASDVVGAAAGGYTTYFITSDGALWSMGNNAYGVLGDGSGNWHSGPVRIATDVATVAAGWGHTLFIRKDGSLWGMGDNTSGQLGTGNYSSVNPPVQVATDAIAVAAGFRHSAYVKSDDTLWSTGYGPDGALGVGTLTTRNTWTNFAHNVTAVAAGDNHTLFLRSDASLWATGKNLGGELGVGHYDPTASPVYVFDSVSVIAANSTTSRFIRADGTLWAMGTGGAYGSGFHGSSPKAIQVLTGPLYAVAINGRSMLTVQSDGSLWGTGSGEFGALGTGNTDSTLVPVPITTGTLRAPSAPLRPRASALDDGTVRLAWDAPVGWRRFEVWRGPTPDFAQATMIAQRVSLPTYRDRTAQAGMIYHYWIKAANPAGVSEASAGVASGVAPPVISQSPSSQMVVVGAIATLSVDATGTVPLTYQWRKDGEEIDGATAATLQLDDVTTAAAGDYDVVVSNAAGSVTSDVATLTVEKLSQTITFPPISDQYIGPGFISITQATATSGLPVSYSVVSGPALLSNTGDALIPTGTGSVTVRATQAGNDTYAAATPVECTFAILPPRNDSFAEAHPVSSGLVVAYGDTTWATRESGEPEHGSDAGGTASLWWKWVVPYSVGADVQITTVGSAFDTVLAVYTGSSLEALTLVAANDDRAAGDSLSSVNFWAPGGTTYYIAIDGKNGAKGEAQLNIGAIPSSGAAPVFTLQPQPVSVVAGNTATFTIDYTGQFPTTLFWQRRAAGTDTWVYVSTSDSFYFSGTGVVLTIRPTAAMNGDQFRCVASNNLGTTYSNAATVTVTETLDSWALEHFTEDELLDPAISGPDADPDGDGFANLLEYALGLDPRAAATNGLPEIGVIATDLAYTYTRPVGRSELIYSVQFSTNLTSWTSEGVTHELVSTPNGVETWRGRVPLSTGANLFLRLRVERP